MLSRLLMIPLFLVWGAVFHLVLPRGTEWVWGGGLFIYWIVLNLYPDKFLLHFLQARESTESQFPEVYRVSRNQAFKLRVGAPKIFVYNGFFPRSFSLQASDRVVFVVERQLITKATPTELESLFFGLALQIKDGSARAVSVSLLNLALWWLPFLKVVALWTHPPRWWGWIAQYFISPVANLWHGWGYTTQQRRRYLQYLATFPHEAAGYRSLGGRFLQPRLHVSPGQEFLYRMSSAAHGFREQLILAIEGAPNPMDHELPTGGEDA